MAAFSLILFDDAVARDWEPFALTRPVGELLFGTTTLRRRAEMVLDAACGAHVAAEHLLGFEEAGAPPVRAAPEADTDRDRIYWLSRAVPGWEDRGRFRPERAGPLTIDGETVGWFAPAGSPTPEPQFFQAPGETATPAPAGETALPGRVLEHVWDLVSCNAEQMIADVEALFPDAPIPTLPAGVYKVGEHPLIVSDGVELEPGTVLDTRQGPIWLDRDCTVRAFSRLCGPAYVGPGSVVIGGSVECVSLGPVCKVRGELTTSTCLGYTNKQHDGHMGHAYLGRWVNLGAETTNSDLKNNYGTIRVWTPRGEVDTGEIKMGSLIGDHVKTGIGLLMNTGTVIGAGSNLFGAEMPPRYVPPFSWGTGSQLVEYKLEKFLEVAERAMARRQVTLSDAHREQLGRAWERGRAMAEAEEERSR